MRGPVWLRGLLLSPLQDDSFVLIPDGLSAEQLPPIRDLAVGPLDHDPARSVRVSLDVTEHYTGDVSDEDLRLMGEFVLELAEEQRARLAA